MWMIRRGFLNAICGVGFGWVLLVLAGLTVSLPLAVLSLLVGSVWVVKDLRRDGLFSPVSVLIGVSLITTVMSLAWMWGFMNRQMPFFSYRLTVDPQLFFLLVREQLVLTGAVYVAHSLVRPTKGLSQRHVQIRPILEERLWLLAYVVGVAALAALVYVSGGVYDVVENLGKKADRAAGNGALVWLIYFGYVGVLLWYRKEVYSRAFLRYGGLLLLTTPFLLTGSRTELFILLLAAAYIDERVGRRTTLLQVAIAGIIIAAAFAAFASFRGHQALNLTVVVYKDLSMHVGFLVAHEKQLLDNGFRPSVLLTALSPVVPTDLKLALGFPEAPSSFFTNAVFGSVSSTFSMGLFGEAHYVVPGVYRVFYYGCVGVLLSSLNRLTRERSILLSAVIAGGAFRIVRGGLTAGVANIMLFLIPLFFVASLAWLLRQLHVTRRGAVYTPRHLQL